jgi:hypothetical protein
MNFGKIQTTMKKAIVNLSTQAYERGRNRLLKSLEGNFDGGVHLFTHEFEVESPLHAENPYAFKIYCIERMRQMGYDLVLWLDASCYPIKNVQPIFDWIEEKGFFMEEAGHWAGRWTNDETLAYFNITREEANKIPLYSAGFTGINFQNETGVKYFELWKKAMHDGYFKGSWENHRHDMTCGSIIAYQMGITKDFSSGGNYFAYIGEAYGTPKDSVIFYVAGA